MDPGIITHVDPIGKNHIIDMKIKQPDDKWHYIQNVFVKKDDGWHPVYTYDWVPDPWGPCSVLCGGGTQTRAVPCKRNDGLVVPDFYCDGSVKPVTTQTCNPQTCNPYSESPQPGWKYTWAWNYYNFQMTYTPDATVPEITDGYYNVVLQAYGGQSQGGNNWGCGRHHYVWEVGKPLSSWNDCSNPRGAYALYAKWNGRSIQGNGTVPYHTHYYHFGMRWMTKDEIQNTLFNFNCNIGQCHWDGQRSIWWQKLILTRDVTKYTYFSYFIRDGWAVTRTYPF